MTVASVLQVEVVQYGPSVGESILIAMTIVATLIGGVYLLGPIAKALARRLEGKHSSQAMQDEIDALRDRVGEVDTLRERVMELEERVDFTERLLAQTQEAPQIPIPGRTEREAHGSR